MIWLYEKDAAALRIETRYDNTALEYVVTVHRSDGSSSERYTALEDFRQRLLTLEKTLADQQWQRVGAPIIDPDGWPRGRPS